MVQYGNASGDEVNLSPARGIITFMHDSVDGMKDIKKDGYGNEKVREETNKKDFEKRTGKFNKKKRQALERGDFEEYQKLKNQKKKHKGKKTSSNDNEESDSQKSHISITSYDGSDCSSESEFETV